MSARRFVLLLAAAVTLATAIKPLHIDDTYLYFRAAYIVEHPLDPSGIEVYWKQWPQPGTESPWPLLFAYWLASGLAFLGERPWLWKIWFFPFHWIFVGSLHALIERFVGRSSRLLTAALALSPTFLPGVNLMLDLPTTGLVLATLCLFARAVDEERPRWALAAGCVAGLAAQGKYNGLVAFAVLMLYALIYRRLRWGFAASAVGSALFWGWEGLLWLRYGESQFLWALAHSFPGKWSKPELALALLPILGATLGWVALLPLARLRRGAVAAACGGALLVAGLASLAFGPFEARVLTTAGVAVLLVTVLSIASLARGSADPHGGRALYFLTSWLGLELLAYLAVSPFGAVRRTQGLAVVVVLLTGRALFAAWGAGGRGGVGAPSAGAVRVAALLAIALGSAYQGLDLLDASATRSAAREGAALADAVPGEGWYTGHWGFAYYAERGGLRPVIPDHSRVRRGDRLVVPRSVARQRIDDGDPRLVPVQEFVWDDALRLSVLDSYSGRYPLRHRAEPRFEVVVHEARRDLVPATPWPARYAARWLTEHRSWGSSERAFPLFERLLAEGDRPTRVLAAEALGAYGPGAAPLAPALASLLGSAETPTQVAALAALAELGNRDRDVLARVEAARSGGPAPVRQAAADALVRLRDEPPDRSTALPPGR